MSIRQLIIANGRKISIPTSPVQVLVRSPFKAGAVGAQNAYAVFASTGGYTQVPTDSYTWLLSGAASDYQIRFTTTAGTPLSGVANNTWLALSTTRTAYLLTLNVKGSIKDCTANVQISYAANSVVISYASCYWYAEHV